MQHMDQSKTSYRCLRVLSKKKPALLVLTAHFVLGRTIIDVDIRAAIKQGQQLVIERFSDYKLPWENSTK